LLDEPLTVIDPHVKWLLRQKLTQIHAELGVTLIYVTHDQTEALTLADQVLVMSEGRVLQHGTPEQLFERPAHTFVGYFIGSPGMNIFPCAIEGGRVSVAGQSVPIESEAAARALVSAGTLELGIRPEFVRMQQQRPDVERAEQVLLAAHVVEVEQLGHARLVFAQLDATPTQRVAIKLPAEGATWAPGAPCFLELPSQHTILYAGGHALG
jgi:glycerol transport system ATP-binding protein